MATCVLVNNNPVSVRVVVVGPNTEARFIMAANACALVDMSLGKKGLVAFTNNGAQTLFVLRQLVVTGTAIFLIKKGNPVQVAGVARYVSAEEEPGDQQYNNKSATQWIEDLQGQTSGSETPTTDGDIEEIGT